MDYKAYMVSPKGRRLMNERLIDRKHPMLDTEWESMITKLKISGNLIDVPLDDRASNILDEYEPKGWFKFIWTNQGNLMTL